MNLCIESLLLNSLNLLTFFYQSLTLTFDENGNISANCKIPFKPDLLLLQDALPAFCVLLFSVWQLIY